MKKEYMPKYKTFHEAFGDNEIAYNGAVWVANQVLDALGDYAAAVEGLGTETITPAKKFDDVRACLAVYLHDIGLIQ